MKLADIKRAFLAGQISKPEYIDQMHTVHAGLFDYAEFIQGTDISKIEITDGLVVMTSREDGLKIICDKDDKRIAPIETLNFENYEESDSRMIHQLITDGNVIFDVGANVGWYAVSIAKKYPKSQIIAFEPIPKTFGYLTKNIALNNSQNVFTNQLGLSDKAGELIFYYYATGAVNASSANLTGDKSVQEIRCPVTTIDDFCAAKDLRVDFIKCDVEGAELFVFKGGVKTIEHWKPVVFAEMLRKWSAKFNYHPNEIIKLFSDLGYRCFTAHGNKLHEFLSMDEETKETNFFFLHPTQHAALIKQFAH